MWCDAPRPDRRGFLGLAVGGVICPSGGCREATGSWLVSHVRLLPGWGRELRIPGRHHWEWWPASWLYYVPCAGAVWLVDM